MQYKEDLAKFHQQHPDAQELLAKAKYMFTLPDGVYINQLWVILFYRKMKRKQKSVSKQPSPATVGEGADELVQSSSLESSAPLTSTPSPPTTADEKGEVEGEEEQEDDEEEVIDNVNSQQNGTEVPEESDNSDSETDSSGSSAED